MAVTSYQLWSPGLSKASKTGEHVHKDDLQQSSQSYSPDSRPSDFPQKPTKISCWVVDDTHNPSCPREEHPCRELAEAPAKKPCKKTQRKALPYHNEASALVALLRTCAKNKDLHRGEQVHDDILKRELLHKCSDALITMYARCGALAKAQELLDMHSSKNLSSWTALISGYARQGQGQDALNCFEQMQRMGISPDAMAFACILKACGSIKALEQGEDIHDKITREGLLENDIVLANAVVHMYIKCGALAKAQHVLEDLPFQDVAPWSALILGHAQRGQGQQALDSFERMQHKGLSPDTVTYSYILKVCGSMKMLDKGVKFHDEIVRKGLLQQDIVLGNALVDMYVKCGSLSKARKVHEELPSRDMISWNALIAGYAQRDEGEQVLNYFELMQREGVNPDAVTFACILKACGSIGAREKGEQIHDVIAKQGLLEDNVLLGTALVNMYAKCGALAKAHQVLKELSFRDVVSWSALIAGYTQHGQGDQALECFEQMQQEGFSPDAVTFSCILNACSSIGAVDKGEQIHKVIAKKGLLGKNIVLGNALVDMYAKCGALTKAQDVFDKLPTRDVVTWTALIGGYAQQGHGEQALHYFEEMQHEGLSPNAVTLACILKACGATGAVDKGEQIHNEIAKQGWLEDNLVLGTAVLDMYVKCGALSKAQQVLAELPCRDVVLWNALISGYTKQGQGERALKCFKIMQHEGLSPDAVTFSCILNVCSHLGLVEDGYLYFASMSTEYGVKPDLEHYTSMVDLFGRSGHLDKAVGMIHEMQGANDSSVWCALLGACQKWGDVSVARWAFEQVVQHDESDSAAYILMANIYAAAGMQEDAKIIQAMRIENKALKNPGRCWWVDMNGNSHLVGNAEYSQSNPMYAKLEGITCKLLQQGHSASLHWMSRNMADDAEMQGLSCGHPEIFALACALIGTPSKEIIRIVKNVQMCGNCHVAISLIAKSEKRKVVVNDAICRHDFEDGKCSCGN